MAENTPEETGLLEGLEADFGEAVKPSGAELEMLREQAKLGSETLVVRESTGLMIIAGALIIGLGGLYGAWGNFSQGVNYPVAAIMLVVGLLFLAFLYFFILRHKTPVVTLDRDGLLFPVLTKRVPWAALEHYDLNANGLIMGAFFYLDPTFDAGPAVKGRHYMKYQPKKHRVTTSLAGIKGMSVEDFSQLLDEYLMGAEARAQLEELGVKP